MERRRLLKQAGLAGVLAVGASPAIVHAQQKIRWRLASSFPKSLETIFGTSEVFSRYVSAATGGKFVISVYPAGELVPPLGVVDAVQQGTIECAHTSPSFFFGKDETFALDCTIPFGMNARSTTAWMFEGNGMKLLREFYARYNIINFPCGNTGTQMGGWYRREIKSAADFNGLKFRIGGFGGRVVSKMGAVPQNIPAGEIYQALEKGTIDAAEFVGPADDMRLGLHKIAKNYYFPAWWEGSTQFSVYINDKQWNSLSDEYKAIVEQASRAAHVMCLARYDARNPNALRQLVGEGTVLQRFPKDFMDVAFKATQDLYAELNDTNEEWKKIHPDYNRFLSEQYQWIPVAEGNYDRYMSMQRL